jgi:hypothetical protein
MIDSTKLKVRNEQQDLGFQGKFSILLLLKFMKNVSNVSIKITSSFAFHFDVAWKKLFSQFFFGSKGGCGKKIGVEENLS